MKNILPIKKMKNTLLAFLIIFSSTITAQKCKETTDPITNEKRVKYECKVVLTGWSTAAVIDFSYEIIDGKAYLIQSFGYGGVISNTVSVGTEIIYKTKKGDILKLKTVSETIPKTYQSSTEYRYVMGLSKEDLDKLASSPVAFIRIPKVSEEGFYDFDQDHIYIKKGGKLYNKGASCISTYVH